MALQQTLGVKLSVFRLEVLYLRTGRLSKVSLSQIRKTVQSFCNHQRCLLSSFITLQFCAFHHKQTVP